MKPEFKERELESSQILSLSLHPIHGVPPSHVPE